MAIQLDNDPLALAEDFELPDLSNATIEQYVPQIKNNWQLGTQSVTEDGRIYARTFNLLRDFPTNFEYYEVPLTYYDDFYEGTNYIVLAGDFCEDIYTSQVPHIDDGTDFLRWEHYSNKVRQEIHFSSKQIGHYRWIRVREQQDDYGNSIIQDLIDQYLGNDDIDYIIAPDTITAPYTFQIDAGKAVKGRVNVTPADKAIEVKLKSRDGTKEIAIANPVEFALMLPVIEITVLELTPFSPLYPLRVLQPEIDIFLQGEEKIRVFIPSFAESEPETLIHPANTPLAQRLKPPGLPNIQDNFWNTNPSNIIVEGFELR